MINASTLKKKLDANGSLRYRGKDKALGQEQSILMFKELENRVFNKDEVVYTENKIQAEVASIPSYHSITDLPEYHTPPKGAKVSDFNNPTISGIETGFLKNTLEKVKAHYVSNAIMSILGLNPYQVVALSVLMGSSFASAQNATVVQGSSTGTKPVFEIFDKIYEIFYEKTNSSYITATVGDSTAHGFLNESGFRLQEAGSSRIVQFLLKSFRTDFHNDPCAEKAINRNITLSNINNFSRLKSILLEIFQNKTLTALGNNTDKCDFYEFGEIFFDCGGIDEQQGKTLTPKYFIDIWDSLTANGLSEEICETLKQKYQDLINDYFPNTHDLTGYEVSLILLGVFVGSWVVAAGIVVLKRCSEAHISCTLPCGNKNVKSNETQENTNNLKKQIEPSKTNEVGTGVPPDLDNVLVHRMEFLNKKLDAPVLPQSENCLSRMTPALRFSLPAQAVDTGNGIHNAVPNIDNENSETATFHY